MFTVYFHSLQEVPYPNCIRLFNFTYDGWAFTPDTIINGQTLKSIFHIMHPLRNITGCDKRSSIWGKKKENRACECATRGITASQPRERRVTCWREKEEEGEEEARHRRRHVDASLPASLLHYNSHDCSSSVR